MINENSLEYGKHKNIVNCSVFVVHIEDSTSNTLKVNLSKVILILMFVYKIDNRILFL